MVIVTKHAEKRLKERSGLSKKSVQRIAEKAFLNGITENETNGYLRQWIMNIKYRNNRPRICKAYGDKLYIFDEQQTLITVLQIPTNMHSQLRSGGKNKKS